VIEFTESGLLEVYRGTRRVSGHRLEREAAESIERDALVHGPGHYEIRRPVIRARVTFPAYEWPVFEINGTAVLP
jgi:hypothetical protein